MTWGSRIKDLGWALQGGASLAWTVSKTGLTRSGPAMLKAWKNGGPTDLAARFGGLLLAEIFQAAGPVFIKVGQILSGRGDLLGPVICEQLSVLLNKQKAPTGDLLERALKKNQLRAALKSWEPSPLGVGSVGAVYQAQLLDGTEVVLKILRPGVQRALKRDMATLRLLATNLFKLKPEWSPYRLLIMETLNELEQGFADECDLKKEAQTLIEFKKRLERRPQLYVPKVFQTLSNETVLVMEKLPGVPLIQAMDQSPEERKRWAELVFKEILTEIFQEGRFHADPHGGNFILMPDGRLGIIDLGLTGQLQEQDQKLITRAVRAMISRDPEAVLEALLGFGRVPEQFDRGAFRNAIAAVVIKHKDQVIGRATGKDVAQGSLETFVQDLFLVAHQHGIFVPSQSALLVKSMVTIEGVARKLHPQLNVLGVATPVILQALAPKWIKRMKSWF